MSFGMVIAMFSPWFGDGSGYNTIFGVLVFVLGYSFLEYEKKEGDE